MIKLLKDYRTKKFRKTKLLKIFCRNKNISKASNFVYKFQVLKSKKLGADLSHLFCGNAPCHCRLSEHSRKIQNLKEHTCGTHRFVKITKNVCDFHAKP